MLNMQGIKKPTFYAFKFLKELGETELKNSDSDSYVCVNENGDVQILLWNLNMPDETHSSDKILFRKKLPAKSIGMVELHVNNIQTGSYSRQIYQTGYKVNDPFTRYYEMGLPSQINPEQVKILKETSSGAPVHSSEIQIKDGVYKESIQMRENDVFLIKLRRI